MTIKNIAKAKPNDPALVNIDGQTFNFQALIQALQQAANALADTEYSITVNPAGSTPAPAPAQ